VARASAIASMAIALVPQEQLDNGVLHVTVDLPNSAEGKAATTAWAASRTQGQRGVE
jgi:hypothetical protein